MIKNNEARDTFWEEIDRANKVAGRLLRTDLGGATNEDVVAAFFEKRIIGGANQQELEAIMHSPKFYGYLKNIKNDLYRAETAVKRGKGAPTVALDQIEFHYGSDSDSPEKKVVENEKVMEAFDLLTKLFGNGVLSQTQLRILRLDVEGYSTKEISELLGTDVNTIYARRAEAHKRIQKAQKSNCE
jgi:DNA-binding CsgD family transcriptional regulator